MCEELLSKLGRVVSFCRGRYTPLFLSCFDLRVNFFLIQILSWEYRPNLELLTVSGPSCSGPGIDSLIKINVMDL